jgi:hypothetical protein
MLSYRGRKKQSDAANSIEKLSRAASRPATTIRLIRLFKFPDLVWLIVLLALYSHDWWRHKGKFWAKEDMLANKFVPYASERQ